MDNKRKGADMNLLPNLAKIRGKTNKERRETTKAKEHNDIRYLQDFTITLAPIHQVVLEAFHKGHQQTII